jgi:hypothetical protein
MRCDREVEGRCPNDRDRQIRLTSHSPPNRGLGPAAAFSRGDQGNSLPKIQGGVVRRTCP